MKSKLIVGMIGLVSIACRLLAAETTTYPPPYTTTPRAPVNYSTPNSGATSSSNAVVVALNAQALLLKDLIQEHQKRAADLTQKNQGEKAKWETDLVNELQDKSAQVQKNIDQATQPIAANNTKAASNVDDPLVFLSTVEAGLERVRQELSAAIEDSRAISMQIGTNKVPEDFAGLSLALAENQKAVKELQREQLDLELRKLEFRAISKLMQK